MKEPATEVVIYKISAEKVGDYEKISKLPESYLKKQEGFLSRKIYRDLKDPQFFLDIVEWESLEAGEKAAKNLESDESLLPFLQATEEVISFSHYKSYP
ncbi:MAG: antibiotic biosynthesis monooxygenase [Bacteroidota bacterium]